MRRTRRWAGSLFLLWLCAGCPGEQDTALDGPVHLSNVGGPGSVVLTDGFTSSALGVEDRGVAHGDFDGDGLQDLAVVQFGCVRIVYGRNPWPKRLSLMDAPALAWDSSTTPNCMGSSGAATGPAVMLGALLVASAGDVDRDGYSDLLITVQGTSWAPIAPDVRGYLLYGGPNRLSGRRVVSDVAQAVFPGIAQIAGARDVNGDGLSDMVVVTVGANQMRRVSVLLGETQRFSGEVDVAQAEVTLVGAESTGLLDALAVGDVNGDGYADLLIMESTFVSDPALVERCQADGRLWLMRGSPTLRGPVDVGAPVYAGHPVLMGHFSAPALGDVDGDGYEDFTFSTWCAPDVNTDLATHIVYGAADIGTAPLQISASVLGERRLTGADVDGEGLRELVIGSSVDDDGNGAIYVRPGSRERLVGNIDPAAVAVRLPSSHPGASRCAADFIGNGINVGDVDGDGLSDVLVPAGMCNGGSAPAYLLLGAVLKTALATQ